uniref:CSON003415 protein n=1 Tax=Culicoides sonorensis TaxID=179676 RepID=A0A336L3T0_CULSO
MDGFFSLFDPADSENNSTDSNNRHHRTNGHHPQRFKETNGNSRHNGNIKKYRGENGREEQQILDFEQGHLPPEPQLGNIEYKLKLINPGAQRLEHLVTQMKWRLREGAGEAIYEIGVSDNGQLYGLSENDMNTSLQTLTTMAQKLGASTTVLRRKSIAGRRSVCEVLVRKVPEDQHNIELRVAVLGANDAGKSTLLGVLTQNEMDNGRGRARLNMFRHLHEIQTGRTSCISHETLGFDADGNVINYGGGEMITAEEISDKSMKLVSFMDCAGYRRYMKTTVHALSGYLPNIACLVISAAGVNKSLGNITEEHMQIIRALDMPFFCVITKVDLTSPELTIRELTLTLSSIGCRKVPYVIYNEDDVLTANARLSENVVPIFCVSNVTGVGLDLLSKFLFVLSPDTSNSEKERLEKEPILFHIDEIFKIAEIGPVCGGLLAKGVITENTKAKVGPLNDGSFHPIEIQTIHRNKAPCRIVKALQSASLSFADTENLPQIRNGMVIISDKDDEDEPRGVYFFQATISVLHHKTTINAGFQCTVHINSIRQTAIIVGIMGSSGLSTGKSGSAVFRFVGHPEYVKPGMRILFREGSTKGIGTVTQVFASNEKAC